MEFFFRYRLDPPIRMTIDYAEPADERLPRRVTLHTVLFDERVVGFEAWCSLARARRIFDATRIVAVVDDAGFAESPKGLIATLKAQIAAGELKPAPPLATNLRERSPRLLRRLTTTLASLQGPTRH